MSEECLNKSINMIPFEEFQELGCFGFKHYVENYIIISFYTGKHYSFHHYTYISQISSFSSQALNPQMLMLVSSASLCLDTNGSAA